MVPTRSCLRCRADATLIVPLLVSIRIDIPDDSLFMFFGSHIWTPDYAKPANGWTGIVQVTRASGTTWLIEPIPADHRIATERLLEADQTSLHMLGSTFSLLETGLQRE